MKKLLILVLFSMSTSKNIQACYHPYKIDLQDAQGEFYTSITMVPENVKIYQRPKNEIKAEIREELETIAADTIAKMSIVATKYKDDLATYKKGSLLKLECHITKIKNDKEKNQILSLS